MLSTRPAGQNLSPQTFTRIKQALEGREEGLRHSRTKRSEGKKLFTILSWRDRESVKPCLSEEKVNECCGICMSWEGNQGQVETRKRREACKGGEGTGVAGCTVQRTLPQALGNSPSAGGSLTVALLQLLPHPWLSALCKLWHQQTLLVSKLLLF